MFLMCILYWLHKFKVGPINGPKKRRPVMASSGNVSPLLKQLSSASQTLSEASNKLTEQIKEIENSLASFNLGVVAWVKLRSTLEEAEAKDGTKYRLNRVDSLGYTKKNEKRALCVSSQLEEFEDDFEWWLLRDAPRALRILAVDGIPNLLEEMVNRAKELTAEVKSKTGQAKSLAHSLRNKQKKAGE